MFVDCSPNRKLQIEIEMDVLDHVCDDWEDDGDEERMESCPHAFSGKIFHTFATRAIAIAIRIKKSDSISII